MVTYPCSKCDGRGRLDWASHVLAGVCFKCGGSGKQKTKPIKKSQKFSIYDNSGQSPFIISAKNANEAVQIAYVKLNAARERNPETFQFDISELKAVPQMI